MSKVLDKNGVEIKRGSIVEVDENSNAMGQKFMGRISDVPFEITPDWGILVSYRNGASRFPREMFTVVREVTPEIDAVLATGIVWENTRQTFDTNKHSDAVRAYRLAIAPAIDEAAIMAMDEYPTLTDWISEVRGDREWFDIHLAHELVQVRKPAPAEKLERKRAWAIHIGLPRVATKS